MDIKRTFIKIFLIINFLFFFPFNVEVQLEKKKLLLFETVVAGFSYYDGEKVWDYLKICNQLNLKREPTKYYDEKAVEIYWNGINLATYPGQITQ